MDGKALVGASSWTDGEGRRLRLLYFSGSEIRVSLSLS